jgi:hypothetical protein
LRPVRGCAKVYGEADLTRTEAARKQAFIVALLIGGAALLLVVAGMIFRIKPLALAAAIVGGCAAYSWSALKIAPWNAYFRFLREMQTGLRRETEGMFVSQAAESRMVDGVRVHDMLLDAGQDVHLLFYWDDEKPRPELEPGQRLKVTSFGKFITSVEAMGRAEGG